MYIPLVRVAPILQDIAACPNDGSGNQRSVWDIIWSCLITIFACTWIAVHPNIPSPHDTQLAIAARRLGIMILALLAPEIVILLAMRQWYNAREIGRQERGRGWTITHGFFIQMGGFMLYDGDEALGPIQLERLRELYGAGRVEWPTITESEIQDRSKGDALSKGLVLLQTSWFIVQCIARGAQSLIITEVELVTVAFAALNFAMYLLWWNKPVDVGYPVPIIMRQPGTVSLNAVNQNLSAPGISSGSGKHGSGVLITWISSSVAIVFICAKRLVEMAYWCLVRKIHIRRRVDQIVSMKQVLFLLSLSRPVTRIFRVLKRIVDPKHPITSSDPLRVASFYAPQTSSSTAPRLMSIVSSLIGVSFGGIHCLAWSFHFPTPREQLIWRTCSLLITCTPLVVEMSWNMMYIPSTDTPTTQNVSWNAISFNVSQDDISDRYGLQPPDPNANPGRPVLPSHLPYLPSHNESRGTISSNVSQVDISDYYWLQPPDPSSTPGRLFLPSRPPSLSPRLPLRPPSRSPPPLGSPSHFPSPPCSPPLPPHSYLTQHGFTSTGLIIIASVTLLVPTTIVYIVARCILLIQALVALRNLLPGALQDVGWTSFIPHL